MDRFRLPVARGRRTFFVLSAILLMVVGRTCSASIIIDEIMQNPAAVSDTRGEWFEVFNAGVAALDLYHWRIADLGSDSHIVSDHLVVPGLGYAVLARSAVGNGGLTPDYVYGSDITLSNGADELLLFDTAGTLADRVDWDGGPGFPDPSGASMALRDPSLDNARGDSWTVSTMPFGAGDLGTPGGENSASPTPDPQPSAVPLPATLWLLAGPAAVLLWSRRAGISRGAEVPTM